MLTAKIEEKEDFECTVLEVKKIDGLGTTIDVILVNGTLRVDDTIVLSGFNGPIATNIRAILTPHPLKEMRVKGDYIHHKSLKGAMGIKISAPNLDDAIAGSSLMRATTKEEIEECKVTLKNNLFRMHSLQIWPTSWINMSTRMSRVYVYKLVHLDRLKHSLNFFYK
jgi:translation initiation factor IF-2